MRCMLPFCACGTKSVSCELQRAFGAIKCFLKHFNGVQYDRSLGQQLYNQKHGATGSLIGKKLDK